jgi:predicted nuclease of predicted toxin-antitoxin system
MNVELDENLPEKIADELRELGHDVDTVRGEGLQGRADSVIWRAAQVERRFLITQDLDFSDVRQFRPGTHAGLLLLRLQDPGRLALTRKVAALFAHEDVATCQPCFVVVTDHKSRVRGP